MKYSEWKKLPPHDIGKTEDGQMRRVPRFVEDDGKLAAQLSPPPVYARPHTPESFIVRECRSSQHSRKGRSEYAFAALAILVWALAIGFTGATLVHFGPQLLGALTDIVEPRMMTSEISHLESPLPPLMVFVVLVVLGSRMYRR